MKPSGLSMLTLRQLPPPATDRMLPMITLERELSGKIFHIAVALFRQRSQTVRQRGFGFFFANGFQRNIQLAGASAGPHDYVADAERGFIICGQHPNYISGTRSRLIVLPGGKNRAGLLAPVRWKKDTWIPVRSPLGFPDRPEEREDHRGRRRKPQC